MTTRKDFRSFAGVTATTLAGVLFFLAIVGVFGLRLAIAGLALFAFGADRYLSHFSGWQYVT